MEENLTDEYAAEQRIDPKDRSHFRCGLRQGDYDTCPCCLAGEEEDDEVANSIKNSCLLNLDLFSKRTIAAASA